MLVSFKGSCTEGFTGSASMSDATSESLVSVGMRPWRIMDNYSDAEAHLYISIQGLQYNISMQGLLILLVKVSVFHLITNIMLFNILHTIFQTIAIWIFWWYISQKESFTIMSKCLYIWTSFAWKKKALVKGRKSFLSTVFQERTWISQKDLQSEYRL